MKSSLENIKWDAQGLVPAVVQDARTLQVLSLAYMNAVSLERTMETRETWFWSRSRSELWHKGQTSGNRQHVVEIKFDCDLDAVRVQVVPEGPACHTGADSCFHNEVPGAQASETVHTAFPVDVARAFKELYEVIGSRKSERPEGSYTTYLFDQGLDKILKKLGEECAETIIAAKNEDGEALVKEVCDLLYHLFVLFVEKGLTLDQLATEVADRRKKATA
jgi:phosphoribosyl-ATP pyrophosphohydrolase/phosphoribosyl-AMP cyclohydrolase